MENTPGDRPIIAPATGRPGRPSGVSRPELWAWLKETWPGARPIQPHASAAISKAELYLAISQIIYDAIKLKVHVKTISKALNGKAVSDEMAAHIAGAIATLYPDPAADGAPLLDLSGEWEVFYVEDDLTAAPTLTEERAFVTQDGASIRGYYDCLSWARAYDFTFNGEVREKCVLGTYQVPDRAGPVGSGAFQLLAIHRNDEWLDGFCVWLDYDSGRVESSRCIWYKRASVYAPTYKADVDRLMAAEIEILARRRQPSAPPAP